jgi:hypothetical protein
VFSDNVTATGASSTIEFRAAGTSWSLGKEKAQIEDYEPSVALCDRPVSTYPPSAE